MDQLTLAKNSSWERFIRPHSAVTDPERRARASMLAAFMLGLFTLSISMSVVYFLIFNQFETEFWVGASLFLLVYLLSRSPYPHLGEYTIVTGITGLIFSILIIRGGGPHNLVWVTVPILLGVVLLPMREAVAFTLLNNAIAIAIGLITPESSPTILASITILLIFTSIIALATKHARQRDQEKLEQQALALARSSARYKELFDDVPVGLFETTAAGEILQANHALLHLLRIPNQQALRAITAPELYVNPAERERWLELMDTEEAMDDFEVQMVRADGQQIWVREQVRAVRNQTGEISHFRGSLEDVTQRRWLQNQLAEQHQKLQMILDAMPNVLLVIDERDRLKALYLPSDFPVPLDQRWAITKENLTEVLPSELTDQVQSSIKMVRQKRVGCAFEQAVRLKGSEQTSYLRLKLSLVTETDDILIVVDDVTKLKEAEEAVQAYAAELELSNAELDAFSHTVAHDLRRPLSHLVGYAHLIREYSEKELTTETAEFLERIEKSAMNMSEMIESLLLLAKLRQADGVVEPVQMSEAVAAALQRIEPDIKKRGVRVRVERPIPNALGYEPWLEEVFANLISNAVQYIGQANPAPAITIRAETLEESVRYEVIDNGLGIPLEHQPRLFDMLTRFHPNESSGTGLGLSIVQRIINKLGGTVGLESAPGQGSKFWFTLPLPPAVTAGRSRVPVMEFAL